MKGDFSRNSFRQAKHYSGVRMQQGRMQLDSDWNEQVDIQSHLDESTRADVFGHGGTPQAQGQAPEATGFAMWILGGQPFLRAGRYYVGGLLCENDADLSLFAQPDLGGEPFVLTPGPYVAYLDVWRHHVTALEDPSLREVALNGPDTTTRTRTVWQVRVLPHGDARSEDLGRTWFPPNGDPSRRGTMAARAVPDASSDNPCIVPASGGYRRLENQLYRVEVHHAGTSGGPNDDSTGPANPNAPNLLAATFKWSRDNGVLASRVTKVFPSERLIELEEVGKDAYRRIQVGQWIELGSEQWALRGKPGVLLQVKSVAGQRVEVEQSLTGLELPGEGELRTVRGWDSVCGAQWIRPGGVQGAQRWLELEDGIQVAFDLETSRSPGQFRTGDYWLIPARTVTADVQWPLDGRGVPVSQPPEGELHRYCALAELMLDDSGAWTLGRDCRRLFPQLGSLTQLVYAGGDGQEVMPPPDGSGARLAKPLRAGVFNGQTPVSGARVRFEVVMEDGPGMLFDAHAPSREGMALDVTTDASGIAEVVWELSRAGWPGAAHFPSQRVEARLVDQDGSTRVHAPLRYSAQLSLASTVAFAPESDDTVLSGAGTVQQALSTLSRQYEMVVLGGDGQELMPHLAPTMLEKPLRVAVKRHGQRVMGAQVQFEILESAGGSLTWGSGSGRAILARTNDEGIAEVWWTPDGDPIRTVQHVSAALVGIDGGPSLAWLPYSFTARQSRSDLVSYSPQARPEALRSALTVQDALEVLGNQLSLHYVSGDAQATLPEQSFSEPLCVGVSRLQVPANDARVVFSVLSGDGGVREWGSQGEFQRYVRVSTRTQADGSMGLAQVEWRAGPRPPPHLVSNAAFQVEARLEQTGPASVPVRFTGRFRRQRTFHYLGGDGQQGNPGETLAAPLEVSVLENGMPRPYAGVEFRVVSNGPTSPNQLRPFDQEQGPSATVVRIMTNAQGVARCAWMLDPMRPTQQVEAVLLEDTGTQTELPPVRFSARLVVPGIRVNAIELGTSPPLSLQAEVFLDIDGFVQKLGEGLTLVCDTALASTAPRLPSTTVALTFDAPYPLTEADKAYWFARMPGGVPSIAEHPFALQPITLVGRVVASGNRLTWMASPASLRWLWSALFYFIEHDQMWDALMQFSFRFTVKHGVIRSADGTRLLDGGPGGGDFEHAFTWFRTFIAMPFTLVAGTQGLGEASEARLAAGTSEKASAERLVVPAGSASRVETGPRTFSGVKQAWGMALDAKRGELLIADQGTNRLVRFDSRGSGTLEPLGKNVAAVEQPTGVCLDTERDEVIVAASGSDAVVVFGRNATGELEKSRTIAGKKTGLSGPVAVALDPVKKRLFVTGSGKTFVTSPGSAARTSPTGFLAVFAADADGDVAPMLRWVSDDLGLGRAAALAIDANRRELFVADHGAESIRVYALDALYAGGRSVAPLRVLQGKATLLSQPLGLSLASGDGGALWVANSRSGTVTVHALEASGDVAPLRTVDIPAAQRKGLRGVLAV